MTLRRKLIALAAGLAAALLIGEARAADITVFCAPPMRAAMTELFARFELATRHVVVVRFEPSKSLIARLAAGERADVAILTAESTDELIKAGRLARRIDLARSPLGVAVRAGRPPPDIRSADAFRRTLLAAKTFARNEGAESGIYMKALIERLGIAERMKPKTTLVSSGYVAELVARGEVQLGAQQLPELMAVAGVEVTPLPAEIQHVIVFSAGLAAAPRAPDAVDALIRFITAPAAAPVLRAAGLDPT
ncbi:MAG TPA: substrate-binding domain-containing protein [Xanthobacteraceae bacterium]